MKNENQHFSADRRKFGRHFWIGAAVAGALSAAVIFTAASAVYRKNRFDLKIGEEKVGSKEYQLCMDLVKYDVKMEIQKRYDALYGEDFWEQSYEGQYGYEILADHTVEKIKYIHVVYDLAEEYGDVAEYYSQGEWVFQDDGEKADLETARIAVERELREKKYDAMIAQMTEDLEVSGDLEAVDRFTLDHLKR